MNDLDLHVAPPHGPTIFGNHLVGTGGVAVLDHLNPNEQVLIEDGQIPDGGGVYVVSVHAYSLLRSPQDYALVVTGNALDLGGNCDTYLAVANAAKVTKMPGDDQVRGKAAAQVPYDTSGYDVHAPQTAANLLETHQEEAASAFLQVELE
jgi:hypothetical protein